MDSKRTRRAPIRFALILSLGTVAPAGAQSDARVVFQPAWTGDVTFLATNTLIGGLTAGLLQALRGGSFQDGFARGTLGGALSFAGRRVAVEDVPGAGLLGRQMSAVGASVVRNASERRPMFSRILVPVGPLLLYVHADAGGERALRARLDAQAAAWLLGGVLDARLDLDWSESLSAGAPVFRTGSHRLLDGDGAVIDGLSVGGLIVLGRGADAIRGHDVFGHERVHILQRDFGDEVWADPFESWLAGVLPGGETFSRYVAPHLTRTYVRALLTDLLDLQWGDRPWEIEAEFMERR